MNLSQLKFGDVFSKELPNLKQDDVETLCNAMSKPQYMDILYKASEFNFDNSEFHNHCDNKGPTFIIMKTVDNLIFGCYTSTSWNLSNVNILDEKMFTFGLISTNSTDVHLDYSLNGCSIQYINDKGPSFANIFSIDKNQLSIYIHDSHEDDNAECLDNWEDFIDDEIDNNEQSLIKSDIYTLVEYNVYEVIDENMQKNKTALLNSISNEKECSETINVNSNHISTVSSILKSGEYDIYFLAWLQRNIHFKLLLRGSNVGFDNKTFHTLCDDIYSTIVIIQTQDNELFGGFTNTLWNCQGPEKIDINAFIFKLKYEDLEIPTKYGIKPMKLAVNASPHIGFAFNKDIILSKDCYTIESSMNHDGTYGYFYKKNNINPREIKHKKFLVKEYEVIQVFFDNKPSTSTNQIDASESSTKTLEEESLIQPVDEESLVQPINEEPLVQPVDEESLVQPINEESLVQPINEESVEKKQKNESLESKGLRKTYKNKYYLKNQNKPKKITPQHIKKPFIHIPIPIIPLALHDELFLAESNILKDIEYKNCLYEWFGKEIQTKLLFRATKHGYLDYDFHRYCDGYKNTLVIIKSYSYIFGGFTTTNWDSDIQYYNENSFIYTLNNPFHQPPAIYYGINDKHKYYPKNTCAYFDYAITIHSECDRMYSFIDPISSIAFNYDSQYGNSLFVDTNKPKVVNKFLVTDYEVFHILNYDEED